MNHRNFWQKIFLNSNTKTNGTTCREEIKNGEQSLLERNGNGKSVKKVNGTAESQKMLKYETVVAFEVYIEVQTFYKYQRLVARGSACFVGPV